VAVTVLQAREEFLQMPRQNLVQHALLGLARAIAIGAANPGARAEFEFDRLFTEAPRRQAACRLRIHYEPETYSGRHPKCRGNTTIFPRFLTKKSLPRRLFNFPEAAFLGVEFTSTDCRLLGPNAFRVPKRIATTGE
jgi:hypothetical protein